MPGKKKEKGKTLSLDEFNSQVDPNASNTANKEASWADMAPFDPKSMSDNKKFWEKDDRSSTYGQRAPAEIDYSKVPDEPPFKAFISNVSYSATREDLKSYFGGKDEIKSLYMSQNDEGNFRGSANIEFFSRDSLLRALQMHGETMLGRQIRVEVSTSLGSRSGGGNNSSYRQRTDYTPVGEVSDDSWSRGEDFRQATSRDDRSDGVLWSSSGSGRYVPPNRRNNFSPTSNFSRQSSSQYSYSSDRQNDDNAGGPYRSRGAQDYENNNSSNYINNNSRSNAPRSRGDDDNYRSYDRYPDDRNSSSRDYYSNDRRCDTNDRDRAGYNDSRGPRRYDDDRPRYDDSRNDKYYNDDRDRDGYGDQRQSDRYRDYQPTQRRDDYADDRQESSDYGGYRKSNYDGYDDAYTNNNSRSARSTESDYSLKQNRDRDMQPSTGVRNDMNGGGRSAEANNDSYGNKYRMNSGGAADDTLSNDGHRSRTYSQRSDHFENSPRYTLESDDKRFHDDAKRGYDDDNRYTGQQGQQREPRERQMSEKEREYEERYERYQNDIREDAANHRQYDNRSRADSGSGSNFDRRYDNRNSNYRGGDGGRGGDRSGRSGGGSNYGGYTRNDGYRNADRRDDRDRGGYDSQRSGGGGGGGYNRSNARDDQYYDRYDGRSGYDGYDKQTEGALPPRKRLELKPRTVAEPPASMPKAAENRPSSIFGNAKPVDTAQREQELAAKRAQKDQQLLSAQRGGAAAKGGGGTRSDVYQPPMRGGGGANAAADSHASSKSAHYNNNIGGSAPGGGPRSNFAPLSPESPLDNGVVNKFAVLNTDDDEDQ